MKYTIYLLVFSTIYWNTSKAETAEQEFQTLCSYDSKWCGKLKNSDGTFVRPKKEIVRLLKELSPVIEKHAATLGVDPRAVAGAIMAENSLNVSISDDVQDLLVKIGVANKGEILGKKFTYGLGQLNFTAAREAENYAAKLEKRAPVSDATLSDALLVPERAIYYVAAVIRKVQDDYKAKGLDISGKPEILTTLYNLGRADSKAAEAKYKGTDPRPNYFGFFVKKYESELSFLSKPVEKKKVEVAAVKVDDKKADTAVAKMKLPAIPAVPVVETRKLKLAFTKSMPLYTSPPVCATSKDYGSTNLKAKYESMKNYAVSAIVDKEKTFEVVAPTIDCDANAWELIKTSTGETGWIKHDDLEKNTAKILITEPKCKSQQDLKCIAGFKEEFNESLIDASKSKNEFFMKPFSNGDKVSFKLADWECRSKNKTDVAAANPGYSSGYTSYGGGGGIGFSGSFGIPARKIAPPQHTDDELQQALGKLDSKIKELETYYNAPMDNPKNPYANSMLPFLKTGLKRCVDKQTFKLDNCKMDIKSLDLLLNDLEAKPKISLEQLSFISHNSSLLSYGMPYVSKADYKTLLASGNMMMYGYGGFGMNGVYGMMGLPSQYLFREGEENNWSSEDVEKSLTECIDTFNSLEAKIASDKNLSPKDSSEMIPDISTIKLKIDAGAGTSLRRFQALPKEEQTKVWPLVEAEFVQTAKLCLSLKDTFKLNSKKDYSSPVIQNYTCFYKNLDVLESGASLMLKDLISDVMYTPQGIKILNTYFDMAFGQNAAGLINPPLTNPNPVSSGYNVSDDQRAVVASYCPNKTAEQIENLVKKYPCVNKVYVPDRWMLNRLNELGDKVIYKPFADDDRYSFDVEKKTCN